MNIRRYQTGDHREIAELFYRSVHESCGRDYTKQQREAWAPTPVDNEKWKRRCDGKKPFLVVEKDQILGFAELENDGHIDCFYVHPEHQKKGVGSFLLNHLENVAGKKGIKKLFAEVSLTAKTFFEGRGFKIVRTNEININNQVLKNFKMEKIIVE